MAAEGIAGPGSMQMVTKDVLAYLMNVYQGNAARTEQDVVVARMEMGVMELVVDQINA
jgi:hypothetical protein